MFAYNCYSVHAKLFVVGGVTMFSQEGTTQGDPISMALYGIGLLPFLKRLHLQSSASNSDLNRDLTQVAFADDISDVTVKILCRENNKWKRWVKESIWIHRLKPTLNETKDDSFKLPVIWHDLIHT